MIKNKKKFNNIIHFYQKILKIQDIFLEESIEALKKPLRNKRDRIQITNVEDVFDILQNRKRSIRIDISACNLVVLDFDLHKIQNTEDRNKV